MLWDTVIGLEVHAQLKTKSKLFSGAPTAFGAKPNSQTNFIDAALPGTLPVLNKEAIKMAIQFGFAIKAQINNHSYFERKNYFYPDLPKGYQISQYQNPILSNGELTIELPNGNKKSIQILRAHLEEDAGKSVHENPHQYSGIDLNRAGTPLLEIVTAPCLYSAEEALCYLRTLHRLVRFLGICDGNMQEGSFRCDVNLSLKPKGSTILGTRTELKNLNSFRFIEKAIAYEQARHKDLLESDLQVRQETLLYSPETNSTHVMRSKESENDYRYFPDPDLLPIELSPEALEQIKQTMPQLPVDIQQNLEKEGILSKEDIHFLLSSPAIYEFFNNTSKASKTEQKTIINWLRGSFAAGLKEGNLGFENSPISASDFALFLNYLTELKISRPIAKKIFAKLWLGEESVDEIFKKEEFLKQSTDENLLDPLVKRLIEENPKQVADYRAGKEKLLAFFIGQVMKETKGQADPEQVNRLVKDYLKK